MAGVVRKHRMDLVILFSTLALMVLGLILIYAISPLRANVMNSAYGLDYAPDHFFRSQLFSVAFSVASLFAAYKIPYKYIRKFAKPILILAIFLSALLFVASLANWSIARCELGECRWLNFGLSIQPAEVLKLALIIYLADFLARAKEEGTIGTRAFWIPLAVIFAITMLLVVGAQGDLGTGIALVAIFAGMLLIAGVPTKQYLIVLGVVLAMAILAIIFGGHRIARVEAWLSVLTGNGGGDTTYHVDNAMLAIGTGGLFGVGIGNSVQATGYLPESINDSIFAVLGETFGFIGLMVIIGVFVAILFRLLKTAERTPASSERFFTVGVFSWLLTQIVVNIMAMTSLLPVTGITLPFLSQGGTSMLFISIAIGISLQLSCYTSREVIKDEDTSSRRGVGRTYNASRRRNS